MTKDYCLTTLTTIEQIETYDSALPSCVLVKVSSENFMHSITFKRSYYAPEQTHTFTTLLLQSMNYLYEKEKT